MIEAQDKLLLTPKQQKPYVKCSEEEAVWNIDGLLKAQLANIEKKGYVIVPKHRLDRPELREELPQDLEYWQDSAQLREWMRERGWCYLGGTQVIDKSRTWYYMSPNGTTWELVESWEGKVISILALYPDGCANCDTPLLREGELYQKIEEAKREVKERIANELNGLYSNLPESALKDKLLEFILYLREDKSSKWQALQGLEEG